MTDTQMRHDWTLPEIKALFALPFNDLLFQAQTIHRRQFDPNSVQISSLLSIKTGACPEDCAYCPQSVHHETGVAADKLMDAASVLAEAERAKAEGASRFCMGAAWRNPKDRDIETLAEIIAGVRGMGLETCMTLGMLTGDQARRLAEAGLDYYNHNIDTSPEFYDEIITTRTFEDRLDTLENVRQPRIRGCISDIRQVFKLENERYLIGIMGQPGFLRAVLIELLNQVGNSRAK